MVALGTPSTTITGEADPGCPLFFYPRYRHFNVNPLLVVGVHNQPDADFLYQQMHNCQGPFWVFPNINTQSPVVWALALLANGCAIVWGLQSYRICTIMRSLHSKIAFVEVLL